MKTQILYAKNQEMAESYLKSQPYDYRFTSVNCDCGESAAIEIYDVCGETTEKIIICEACYNNSAVKSRVE